MAKRKSGLSASGKRVAKKELSDEQLKSMKRVGRPPIGLATKQLIALRLEPKLIEQLKSLAQSEGIGYQTLINQILQDYLEKKSA